MAMGRARFLCAALAALCACTVAPYDEEESFLEMLESLRSDVTWRSQEEPTGLRDREAVGDPAEMPGWYGETGNPLLSGIPSTRPLTLDETLALALRHSHQIRVFADLPLIRETGTAEAEGAFDFRAFVEPTYDHRDEPVGSSLVSGTRDRLVEDEGSVRAGFRRRIETGGEVTVSERVGDEESSADFFVPGRQSSTTLALRVVQPLLFGAGIRYNTSTIRLASLDAAIADHELRRQVESHLLEIARAYWSLYAARAVYAIHLRQAQTIREIVDELNARGEADVLRHQILRAESALWDRQADLVRAETAILNAQERLRALINEETGWGQTEVIPSSDLLTTAVPIEELRGAGRVAIENRPEIEQAFLQLRAAAVRLGMNTNETLPTLNLILEGRMQGLADGPDLSGAWDDQWDATEAGGMVALLFEIPLGNTTARARQIRRRIEMRQQIHQLLTTVDTVMLEVRISEQEVDVSWRDLVAKSRQALAAREEVEHLLARRDLEVLTEPTSHFILDLMAAQDRQVGAERGLATALAVYQVAVLNLQRAKGTLLQYAHVVPVRSQEDDLPVLRLEGQR